MDYVFKMQDLCHPLIQAKLHLKVALVTQSRKTPWNATRILEKGWLRSFTLRYHEIAIRRSQILEVVRARGLCPTTIETLYSNLEYLYSSYNYLLSHI